MFPFRILILVLVISASVYFAEGEISENVLKVKQSTKFKKPVSTGGPKSTRFEAFKPNPVSPSNAQRAKPDLKASKKADTSVAPKKKQDGEKAKLNSASPSSSRGAKLDLEAARKAKTSAAPENKQNEEKKKLSSASLSNSQGKKTDLETSGKADNSLAPEEKQYHEEGKPNGRDARKFRRKTLLLNGKRLSENEARVKRVNEGKMKRKKRSNWWLDYDWTD